MVVECTNPKRSATTRQAENFRLAFTKSDDYDCGMNRISFRLPPALARLVAKYKADPSCVIRAALARLKADPLTDAELDAAKLPRGMARFSRKKQREIQSLGGRAKSQVSTTSDE